MKCEIERTGEKVDLDSSNFKVKGGEGSIYIIGDVVYKVCEDGKMIPMDKFKELAVITHPRIVKPEDIILYRKKPVGYTMKKVPRNAVPLERILTKTFREREGVTPDIMSKLVMQMYDGIKNGIHFNPKMLQVDGNTLNYMVTEDFLDLFFIDVNSFQTPSYRADAIMASIRDWQCDPVNFSQLSDWFSYAIVSWQMFTAIHPYKQIHPRFTDKKTAMVDQITAGVSILDKDSAYPKNACYPFDSVIPGGPTGAYMQWYRALFVDNKRLMPPDSFQSVLGFVAKVKEIIGSNNFDIIMNRDYSSTITGFCEKNGRTIAVTTDGLFVDNQSKIKHQGKFRVGFTTAGTPVALYLENGRASIWNIQDTIKLDFDVPAEDVMSYDGRLYVKYDKSIFELAYVENVHKITPVLKTIASVSPNATQLFQGVAFQDMFGNCMASMFPKSEYHRQIMIKELDYRVKISDAKFENNVLMVLVSELDGQNSRYVFKFSEDWLTYDVRKIENVIPTGINFTVLDNGTVICITEEEKVEIFSNKKGADSIKIIDDSEITSAMKLCHRGNKVQLAHATRLYDFSVRKKNP